MATFTLTPASLATPHPVLGSPGVVGPAFQATAFQDNAFQTLLGVSAAALATPHPVLGSAAVMVHGSLTAAPLAVLPPSFSAIQLGRNQFTAVSLATPVPKVGPATMVGGKFNLTAANLSSPPPVLPAPLLRTTPYVQPLPATVPPVQSGYMLHDQSDFAEVLADLLPSGIAWPRDRDSVLMQVVYGMAGPWGDVAKATDTLLITESDPSRTTLMLPDWEQSFGLPDKCLAEPLTLAERRAALIQRMTLVGAQDRNFFISIAASIGYQINRIIEFSPYMCGISRCGDTRNLNAEWDSNRYRWELGDDSLRYWWIVRVGNERLTQFHCASGQCGIDRLLWFGFATDLECLLRRLKPGHTEIIFDYSQITQMSIPPAYLLTPTPAFGTPTLTVH